MSVIKYDPTTPFGSRVANSIRNLRQAQADFQRCKQMADDLTGGGVTTANLEGSTQFNVASGQGAAFYAAIQSINSALFSNASTYTPVQATVDLDQG